METMVKDIMHDVLTQVNEIIKKEHGYPTDADVTDNIDVIFTDITDIPLQSFDELLEQTLDKDKAPEYVVLLMKDGSWYMIESRELRGIKDKNTPDFILRSMPEKEAGFYLTNQNLKLTTIH